MKLLKGILAAGVGCVVLVFLVDLYLHPNSYLPGKKPPPTHPVDLPPALEPSPSPPIAPAPTPTPTPSPPNRSSSTPPPPPPVRSPLDLEAVHDLIRDRKEGDLEGQSFEWTYHEASPFLWGTVSTLGEIGPAIYSLKGRKDQWFAVEIPHEDPAWSPSKIEAGLPRELGVLWGSWVGTHRAAPAGSDWGRLKRLPVLRPLEVEWVEKAEESTPPPSRPRIEMEVGGLHPVHANSHDPGGENPEFRLVEIRRETLDVDSGFERYSPWSLTHLLFHDGEWLLSAEDYERVENWDRRMRNQFENFESPAVRQAVVGDFIRLLGYSKARRVGIVFNGPEGLPAHRWVPDPSLDRQSGDVGDEVPTAAGELDFADATTSLGAAPKPEPSLQQRLLASLFAQEKRILGGVVQRTRQERIWIGPLPGRTLLPESGERSVHDQLLDILDLTEAEELVFRIRPYWFDRVETLFGPAETLRTETYPPSVPISGERAAPQQVSIVWHVYGGVRVGKANPIVEGPGPVSDLIVVAVDVPKWRRLNRPAGLTRAPGR